MLPLLAIAAGGALGAVCRHGVNVGMSQVLRQPFPYGTLCANVVGCFLMGVLVAAFARYGNPSQEIRLFLTVGFLGAFTTFSTFSMDAVAIYMRGEVMTFFLYTAGSVLLGLGAFILGSLIIWKVFA